MAVIKEKIENQVFDEERALYNLKNTEVLNCTFAGKQDGESVLKETRNIKVVNSKFSLRYPLWHAKKYEIVNSAFDELTRAPIWYSEDGIIDNCDFQGIKLLRECNNAQIKNSNIISAEFGWKCRDINIQDSKIISEYIFLDSQNIKLKNMVYFYAVGKSYFPLHKNLELCVRFSHYNRKLTRVEKWKIKAFLIYCAIGKQKFTKKFATYFRKINY